MTYRIANVGDSFYVTNDIDPLYGPYDTEAKAKRRIRDLKAKEAAKVVDTATEADILSGVEYDKAFEHHTKEVPVATIRPVGVYPAISKHKHQRRAYGRGVNNC